MVNTCFILPQLKNKYNIHFFFFSILENFFKSFDIKVYTINNAKNFETIEILSSSANVNKDNFKEMTILTVESIQSM